MAKQKCCWVAKHYNKGWKLGLAVGNKPTTWLRGVYFFDNKQVEQVLKGAGIVFVAMRKDESK